MLLITVVVPVRRKLTNNDSIIESKRIADHPQKSEKGLLATNLILLHRENADFKGPKVSYDERH